MYEYPKDVRIQLALERGITVDEEDMWWLEWRAWCVSKGGYAQAYYKVKTIKLHHCIMGQPIWEGEEIDHIDRNKLNNQRSNLRWVNRFQQMQNMKHVEHATHITERNPGRYSVSIFRNGIRHNETFGSIEEAIASREEFLAKHT